MQAWHWLGTSVHIPQLPLAVCNSITLLPDTGSVRSECRRTAQHLPSLVPSMSGMLQLPDMATKTHGEGD